MIIFKTPEEEHLVGIFTEISSAYCDTLDKAQEQIKDYNALAFPRQGLNSQLKRI
ncbi:MAG: hypothetical protein ACTXOO_02770 [Sodalis sp. (in: enterobacteria)]